MKLTVDTLVVVPGRRGVKDMSVAEALRWAKEHAPVDEETGEAIVRTPEEWIVYGVRREMALKKDERRVARGAAPDTIYVARTEPVKGAGEKADAARDEAKARLARFLHVEVRTKPEPKARKPRAKAKPKAKELPLAPPVSEENKAVAGF